MKKNIFLIILSMVLVCVFSFGLVYGLTNYSKLKSGTDNSTSSDTKFNTDLLNKYNAEITLLNEDIVNLNTQIAELQNSSKTYLSQIEELNIQKSTLETRIENLTTEKNKNEEDIANLNSQIITLNTQIEILKQSEEDNTTVISNLNETIKNLESQKATLETTNENKDTQITNLNNEISTLNTKIINLNNQIDSLNSQINSLTTQVTELQVKVTSYENKFSDCEISLVPITWNVRDFAFGSKVWTNYKGDIFYSDGFIQYKFDKENMQWITSGAYKCDSSYTAYADGSLLWSVGNCNYLSDGSNQQISSTTVGVMNSYITEGVTSFSGKDVFVFDGKAYLKNNGYLYVKEDSDYGCSWNKVLFGGDLYTLFFMSYSRLIEYNGEVYTKVERMKGWGGSSVIVKLDFETCTWDDSVTFSNSILFDDNVWTDGNNYYYSNNGAHYKIVFVNKTETETTKPATTYCYQLSSSSIDLSTFTNNIELADSFTYNSKDCDKIFIGIEQDSDTTKYVIKFHYIDTNEYVTIGSNIDGTQSDFCVDINFNSEPTDEVLTFLQSYCLRIFLHVTN